MHSYQSPSDQTSSSISRTFWRYAIPSVAAMLVNGLYQIVDGIFIGQYVGYQGLAGINMAWPIIYIFAGIGLMIGMGSGSLLSINRGENSLTGDDKKLVSTKVNNTLASALLLVIGFGLIGSIVLNLSVDTLLLMQGGSGQTLLMAQQYTTPFTWSLVFTILAAAIPILVRNDESPNIATGLMVMGACLNIVLDYLLIVQFNMALQGAAIATISAQISVSILGIGYFISSKTDFKFNASAFIFSPKLAGKIMILGASSFVMYLYTSFVFALHNRLFMEYGSSLTVGAFAIVGYLMVLYYFVAEGLGEGMQPPVSFFFGAREPKNIKRMFQLAAKVSISAGLLWVLILNLFPEAIIGLFNSEDRALMTETIVGIQLHLFAMFLDGFVVLAIMYFMAVNQGGRSLWISVGNMVVQLPFLFILPKVFGINGVWLAMPVSNLVIFAVVAPMVWRHLNSAIESGRELSTA
ncbi:MATE family efflux transporter [Shewanella woodyi]|uniref:Multidrug export protein MepA n=1 Tax=Shewanella woodyi (strain ATCC 51908 / MS32) TaxID=392500 RepID=B1KLA0_SHEWM|nr:MATE family efflux transporter [Shewanella woodyi]ACA84441.1 multi antimicrobial extrusion protein MatE [Shewanella woodyi ATCC 51908]